MNAQPVANDTISLRRHKVTIRQEIIDRVVARRGRFHLFDSFDPKKTAIVIIDMQPTFLTPGGPAEVPIARSIVPNLNKLTETVRQAGGAVIWVVHANDRIGNTSDWEGFYSRFVSNDVRDKTIEMNLPQPIGQGLWHELKVGEKDIHITKNRYSALISGSSQLERVLRSAGIETLLIAGTKTNVCCESTGRDGMMLDFNVVMISDCTAALSDSEQRASLETFIQQFGDVMTSEEIRSRLLPAKTTV